MLQLASPLTRMHGHTSVVLRDWRVDLSAGKCQPHTCMQPFVSFRTFGAFGVITPNSDSIPVLFPCLVLCPCVAITLPLVCRSYQRRVEVCCKLLSLLIHSSPMVWRGSLAFHCFFYISLDVASVSCFVTPGLCSSLITFHLTGFSNTNDSIRTLHDGASLCELVCDATRNALRDAPHATC